MKLDEFTARFGPCFNRTAAWDDNTGASGDTWSLSSSPSCQQRFPSFANRVVLMGKEAVVRVIDKGTLGDATTVNLKSEKLVQNPAPPQPAPAPIPPPQPPPNPATPAPNIGTTPNQLPPSDDLSKTNLEPLNSPSP